MGTLRVRNIHSNVYPPDVYISGDDPVSNIGTRQQLNDY